MDITADTRTDPEASEPLSSAALNPRTDVCVGPYRLRFAESRGDLLALQRLRFEVFNLELGEGFAESYTTGRDEDAFDEHCQHLLVEHAPTGAIVGTYRIQLADSRVGGAGLYSATEFDLGLLPPEVMSDGVELGRACVHPDHRRKSVLFLLWRGLAAYVTHHGKGSLFGCSSLTSEDPAEGLRFLQQLEEGGYLHPVLRVEPLRAFRCEAPAGACDGPRIKVPQLFGIYLKHGAKILGPPALDRDFGTIDFFTRLEVTPDHLRVFGVS